MDRKDWQKVGITMERVIGEGGCGTVWLVKSQGEKYALKVGVKNRILREYQFLKQNPHPLLPKVNAFYEFGEEAGMRMELIEGKNLMRMKEENCFPQKEACDLLICAAEGIRVLHSMRPPVIWTDCKPANLIYIGNGKCRLVDFDAIQYAKEDIDHYGTLPFAAPEQKRAGVCLDERTDIYCLGASFSYLTRGGKQTIPRYILKNCQQIDPASRFQTISELLYFLKRKGKGMK